MSIIHSVSNSSSVLSRSCLQLRYITGIRLCPPAPVSCIVHKSALSTSAIAFAESTLSKSPNRRPEGQNIARLVPRSGLINLIDSRGSFRPNVSLSTSLASLNSHEKLVVVRLEGPPPDEDVDPAVHCKIISNKARRQKESDSPVRSPLKLKSSTKKAPSTLKTKSVTLGWSIAPNDLLIQKKSSIHSWFEKGHPIQIILGKSGKRQQRTPNSTLDLEKRKIVLKTCRTLCEEAGAIEQSTEGDVNSNVFILNYLPPSNREEPKQDEGL